MKTWLVTKIDNLGENFVYPQCHESSFGMEDHPKFALKVIPLLVSSRTKIVYKYGLKKKGTITTILNEKISSNHGFKIMQSWFSHNLPILKYLYHNNISDFLRPSYQSNFNYNLCKIVSRSYQYWLVTGRQVVWLVDWYIFQKIKS